MKIDVRLDDFEKFENVLDIEVPDILKKRIPSGIPYVDAIFNGGFLRTNTILFTGTPGAGKSTLAIQLANKLTGAGHKVMYNSCEEHLYQIAMTCERLRIKHGFVPGADSDVNKLLERAERLKIDFLITDSLQAMEDPKYGSGYRTSGPASDVRILEKIVNWTQTSHKVAIVIGQVGKSGTFKGDNKLKHMVDGHLHLQIDTDEKSDFYGCRLLELQKYRFGPAGSTHVLKLDKYGLTEA